MQFFTFLKIHFILRLYNWSLCILWFIWWAKTMLASFTNELNLLLSVQTEGPVGRLGCPLWGSIQMLWDLRGHWSQRAGRLNLPGGAQTGRGKEWVGGRPRGGLIFVLLSFLIYLQHSFPSLYLNYLPLTMLRAILNLYQPSFTSCWKAFL